MIASLLRYFWYLLRHKWYVFVECCKLGVPWLGVIHDLSKFSLAEYPLAARRYCGTAEERERAKEPYRWAWLHHQHHNKHHWVYWVLFAPIPGQEYDEAKGCIPMPSRYRREMLADWRGSGRTFGQPDTSAWYGAKREEILLHPQTRQWVEEQLHG